MTLKIVLRSVLGVSERPRLERPRVGMVEVFLRGLLAMAEVPWAT